MITQINSKGQQVVEYGLFLALTAAVLMTMFVYVRRGLQATIKSQADQIASQQDSYPVMVTAARESSEMETYTRGGTRVRRSAVTGNAVYDVDTSSTTSGYSEVIADEYVGVYEGES